MIRYRIQFEITVSENIPDEDVAEWARFMVGDTGKLSCKNPLHDESFDPIFETFKIEKVEQ